MIRTAANAKAIKTATTATMATKVVMTNKATVTTKVVMTNKATVATEMVMTATQLIQYALTSLFRFRLIQTQTTSQVKIFLSFSPLLNQDQLTIARNT